MSGTTGRHKTPAETISYELPRQRGCSTRRLNRVFEGQAVGIERVGLCGGLVRERRPDHFCLNAIPLAARVTPIRVSIRDLRVDQSNRALVDHSW